MNGSIPTWQLGLSAGLLAFGYALGTVQLPSIYARYTDTKVHLIEHAVLPLHDFNTVCVSVAQLTEDFGGKMTWIFLSVVLSRTGGKPLLSAVHVSSHHINDQICPDTLPLCD